MKTALSSPVYLFLLVCVAFAPPAAAGDLRVGAASATVNPPDGVHLGGYEYGRKSTGVHDNLYAKAVVFDDGKTPIALVVVDALSLQYPTVQEIRRLAAEQAKLPGLSAEHVIVQATHSHGAPDTIGIYGPDAQTSGVNPAYMESLVQTAAAQVERACGVLAPAHLVWARTEGGEWAVNDCEPEVIDRSVALLQCLSEAGESIATLTNFACHPTVLDGDNTLVTSDWVGTFYRDMAAALPGEHLFLQGGIGCWIQPQTPERTFELAERYGADLAKRVIAALQDAKRLSDTTLRFADKVFEMPQQNPGFAEMSAAGLIPRDMKGGTVETEVAWFAIGPAQFATHPGETAPVFTRETKALMDTEPKFVLGLGLDHLGYICPVRYFDPAEKVPFAEYLTVMSPGKDAGAAMMDALKRIIP